MQVVFMGTPDFAVPTLEALIKKGHRVLAVVTQPDKPKGRGKQVQPGPVKQAAGKYGLPVLQPASVKTPEFLATLQELKPEVMVVVAYGKILPRAVLALPPYGCINVHASLLPGYRGAAPIHWAVMNGETRTGVTTMLMDAGMDTGDVLLKGELIIGPEDNVGTVHDRLARLGADLLVQTLDLAAGGKLSRTPQDHRQATYASLLKKEHEKIDWARSARAIHDHVRGMDPWPGAYTICDGRVLKIWQTRLIREQSLAKGVPGEILSVQPDQGLVVQTGSGQLLISELQLQGSKRMDTISFLRGKKVLPGTLLGKEE